MTKSEQAYYEYYRKNINFNVYPREWLIRALLGPSLRELFPKSFKDSYVLDLGFGDCRNLVLLNDLKFKLFGTEISQSIIDLGYSRLEKMGISAKLCLGCSYSLPFSNDFFDLVVASSSAYFIADNGNFSQNLKEIARVLKPNGFLLCSLIKDKSQILENAIPVKKGYFIVNRGQRGLSNGSMIISFKTEYEILEYFKDYFYSTKIGISENDYWGIKDYHFLVCSQKNKV